MFVSQCLGGKGGKLLPALGLKQGHAEPDGKKKTASNDLGKLTIMTIKYY
jgi:hypothetical protein